MLTLNALRVLRAAPTLARLGSSKRAHKASGYTRISMMKFLSWLVDSNEREVRRLEPLVARINELEPEYEAMSDAELRGVTGTLRARLQDELGELLTPIELRDVPPGEEEETELPAAIRRATARSARSSASGSASRSTPRWKRSCRRRSPSARR